MALLENAPRSASVKTRETTQLIALNIGSFMTKIRRDPTFAFNIMQKMSNRIRLLNNRLLKMRAVESQIDADIEYGVIRSEYMTSGESGDEIG